MQVKRLLLSAVAALGLTAFGLSASANAAGPTASGAGHEQLADKGKSSFTLIYRGGFRGGFGGYRGGFAARPGFYGGRSFAFAGRQGFYGGGWGGRGGVGAGLAGMVAGAVGRCRPKGFQGFWSLPFRLETGGQRPANCLP